MSGTTGTRRRRERFLAVIGKALDALHAYGDGDAGRARDHLRETAHLADRLAAGVEQRQQVAPGDRLGEGRLRAKHEHN